MATIARATPKTNYLNNRDILKEIHLSKKNYCAYINPDLDHQYDIILPSVSKINQKTTAEARRNRADRIKRETGEIVDPQENPQHRHCFSYHDLGTHTHGTQKNHQSCC